MAMTPAEKQKAYRERRKNRDREYGHYDRLNPTPEQIFGEGTAKTAVLNIVDQLWQERALNTAARVKLRGAILAL